MGIRQTLVLPDGRTLAYRIFGDPGGFPVLTCHGGLMSGLDAEAGDALARVRGIALISPDRPGIGGTSLRPGHRMLDWAQGDVTALLDHLAASGFDLSRFGVTGWSEGGQYALAVARVHAERVTRVVVAAGALPLDDASTFAALNGTDRRLAWLSEHTPRLARAVFGAMRTAVAVAPALAVRVSGRALDASDALLLRNRTSWFSRAVGEGLADTRGAVEEYHAFVSAWGFEPSEVVVPVALHQGEADRLVPAAWAHELAARLPDARVRLYPAEGHFIGVSRRGEMLDEFAADAAMRAGAR